MFQSVIMLWVFTRERFPAPNIEKRVMSLNVAA